MKMILMILVCFDVFVLLNDLFFCFNMIKSSSKISCSGSGVFGDPHPYPQAILKRTGRVQGYK